MNGTDIGRHLSDSELFACLDEEATASERARCEEHMRECSRCSDQLEGLRADSRLVGEWLERAAFEDAAPAAAAPRQAGPERRFLLAPWLRAAAVLALLAAPVAAIPALREWVVERVTPGDAPGTATAASGTGEGTVLRFVPDPGEFRVTFDADASGSLTIGPASDEAAMLRGSGVDPEATVSPSELRVRGSGAGDYVLRVPESITSVRVRIGERAVAVSASEIRAGTVVELEGGSPR